MHPKKSFFITNPQTQQPPAMPPSHSYTGFSDLSMGDDIDIGDICPICDGDCICNSSTPANNTPTPAPPAARPAAPAPLKIKLTVPAKLLKRPHAPSPSAAKHNDNPKRRGRPSKPRPVAAKAPPPTQNQNQNPKKSKPAPRASHTTGRRKPPPRRGSDDEYCPAGAPPSAPDADPTIPFPTFMSMSALSSASSSSSSESETETFDFDGDSSIEGEEEQFIVAEERHREHERARVRRELLGDPVFGSGTRRRTSNWEIRPRKASGDEMDVAMDADSEDADTEDDDDDETEAEDGEDADEADVEEEGPGPVRGEETGEGEEDEETVTYAGIATGWSEDDEESSQDAELFFAGLTDSSDSDAPLPMDDGDDGEETVSEGEGDHRQGVAFEVTEGWDGTYIFTNGLGPGQGLLDFDFDANVDAAHAQLFLAAPHSSGSSCDSDGDVDVKMEMDEDFGAWETGYERDEDEGDSAAEMAMESDDGATTDEELVDENGLPTERLMRLFRPLPLLPPFNSIPVSAINPMSTMSPGPTEHRSRRRSSADLQSPRPLDILEGRHAFWDPGYDDEEDCSAEEGGVPVQDVAGLTLRGSSEEEEKRGSPSKKRKSGPRMGMFPTSGGDALRRAVIDGSDGRPAEVPSPFPRTCTRKRRRGEDDVGSGREMSYSRARSLSLSALSVAQSSNPLSPSPLAPSEIPMSPSLELPPPSVQPSPEPEPEPVLLSDVLDASLLDSDPFEPPSTDPSCLPLPSSSTGAPYDDENADNHGRHLQRWDRIPMGTFRRTREVGDDLVLDGMMRSSPFSGVLWSAKGAAAAPTEPASPTARKGKGKAKATRRGSSARRDVVISPVILPVRDRDGDRMPTTAEQLLSPPKGGKRSKESRRDKMMKRKSMMGVSPGGSGGKHHRHHQHHPNSKGRALGGVQRGGGYGGAVPPLSL